MNKAELLRRLAKIKLLVLDFDGVLTDGLVYFTEDGYEMVRCSRKDSLGTNLLQKMGIEVFIISKEKNKIVSTRAKKMGIDCLQSVNDKVGALNKLSKELKLDMSQVCFMGDDVNDIEAMELAGISVAVADANKKVKNVSSYVTTKKGGHGAVREICDLIIR